MKIPGGYRAGCLQQSVRERGFAMINMGDDTEISYV